MNWCYLNLVVLLLFYSHRALSRHLGTRKSSYSWSRYTFLDKAAAFITLNTMVFSAFETVYFSFASLFSYWRLFLHFKFSRASVRWERLISENNWNSLWDQNHFCFYFIISNIWKTSYKLMFCVGISSRLHLAALRENFILSFTIRRFCCLQNGRQALLM